MNTFFFIRLAQKESQLNALKADLSHLVDVLQAQKSKNNVSYSESLKIHSFKKVLY